MSTTHKTASDLFTQYRLDWEAAMNPCLDCLLRYCPDSEREALTLLLDDYLQHCPMPPYSPVQLRREHQRIQPLIDRAMNDPAVIAAEDQRTAEWRDTPWLLKRYRRARFALLCLRLRLKTRRQANPWD